MNPEVLTVFFFQAPPGLRFLPRDIPPGQEEIELIVAGRGRFEVAPGEWRDAGPGSMVWYRSGDVVEAESDPEEPYECYVFNFSPSGLFPPPPKLSEWTHPDECRGFCEQAMALYRAGDAIRTAIEARCHWEILAARHRRETGGRHPALERAMAKIERDFRKPLSLKNLARHAGVSEPHLYLLFRNELGTSPRQLLLRYRLEEARHLLAMTDMPVKEIAAAAGFPDAGNFAAQFKRRYGVAPAASRASSRRAFTTCQNSCR